ncbi:conserved exported hypothetical protein [Candidatus Terasakiella magnetica]|nr:conserved exported hypothetical protein [Candidatus Terasakiella magnetica]
MTRLSLAALLCLFAVPALADGRATPVTDPQTLKACGECHMTFQPAFLPARSWERVMDGLGTHFGDNAAMPPEKTAAIRKVLVAGAGDGAAGGRLGGKWMRRLPADAAPLRITDHPAFARKHDFSPAVWKKPEVVTKSNCPACHKTAEQGWYED